MYGKRKSKSNFDPQQILIQILCMELLNKITKIALRKKIVVAMSGGVDSSVVAAVMNAQGHEVIGITLQLYDHGLALQKKGACCAGQDIYDAQMAAEKIGIPHYVLNYESIFKEAVINDFADSYLKGETPIPCVQCNQSVKFKDLFKVAKDLGADFLTTGHYVRKVKTDKGAELHRGLDGNKDQSYFLFATTQEQLEYIDFPLGALTKVETRKLAQYFALAISDKPDSQDICFVPQGNYRDVVTKMRPHALETGDIVDIDGKILGKHNGIINFTVGQRRGIGIASSKPLYVIKLDPTCNRVVVGHEEHLYSRYVRVRNINWLGFEPLESLQCSVQLRSMHTPLTAKVTKHHAENNTVHIELAAPYKGITPGQACVFYDGSRVLGGGWIEAA